MKVLTEENWQKNWESARLTLQDIVKELEKPASDPREEMPKPMLQNRCTGYERSERRYGA